MNITFEKDGNAFHSKFPTKSGNLILSIKAGEWSYSTPRSEEKDSSAYTKVELAIFDKTGRWASKSELQEVFKILETEGEHATNESMESRRADVIGWVPLAKIHEIWEKC
jgi:hypothetical protein